MDIKSLNMGIYDIDKTAEQGTDREIQASGYFKIVGINSGKEIDRLIDRNIAHMVLVILKVSADL